MKKLQNKLAVITGASRGIGLSILRKLAEDGANIIACSTHFTEEIETTYRKIAMDNGVNITPVYFDMSDEHAVKDGIKKIKAFKKTVDILINNAGVGHISLLPFTRMADAHKVFQVNFFSPLIIIQGLLGLLKKSEAPVILNMVSVAGLDGGVGVSIYGASKASMILVTKVLAQEFSQLKIRVNAVAPGMIKTDMADEMGEKAKESMVASTAIKRLGQTNEVANTVAFLVSQDSSYINGQIIRVDGGIS